MPSINQVAQSLEESSREFMQEAGLQLALGNRAAAVSPLSYGAACCFHACRLRHGGASAVVMQNTLRSVDLESEFWSTRGAPKTAVHGPSRDEAFTRVQQLRRRGCGLFWLGYYFAEYWENGEALNIFNRLAEKSSRPVVLHWTGNLLAKLGRFAEARPYLERARRLEPGRYHHYSHLGNVYRGLNLSREAGACYRRAINLIRQRPLGRVERIHLARCYHGLNQLGDGAFADEERCERLAALESGLVREVELNRIMF